jgi:(E)-4-hydroxy-3-methylbut-2-enyl-diphosphate synthase
MMTREVKVGTVSIGGDSPVRIQSMTTTVTSDVEASIAQSISLIKAGSELVRLTAPSIKDADALEAIVAGVRKAGYSTPIVADIHFTPNAAYRAADFVEKIRINPGNFADKKKFAHHEYTDASYAEELVRIKQKFTPLVVKCKELGRVMRIGTNHGSLSDRITSRFGDTALGMVESALEFIRICRDHDYHELVISMKSSNTGIMVEAYRLLVRRMGEEGMNYPLHLGVTEAGDGEDGRIKSAIGIGTLLEEGIGDTIRVSLTEAPEAEIPVARAIVDRYVDHVGDTWGEATAKRVSHELGNVGHKNVPVVVSSLGNIGPVTVANLVGVGYMYSVPDDKWNIADQACDYVYTGDRLVDFPLPGTLKVIVDVGVWDEEKEGHLPMWTLEEFKNLDEGTGAKCTNFLSLNTDEIDEFLGLKSLRNNCVIVLSSALHLPLSDLRRAIAKVEDAGVMWPIILRNTIEDEGIKNFTLYQSIDAGALLLDGKLDGVWVDGAGVSLSERNRMSFGILQATRTRISKTEYISCPSCGRTLFDLEETTAKIRNATNHLKGVKIGIMGCIVNGPGEMADADFGYVGTGPGKITLYRERDVVRKNVPEAEGVQALIDLIKSAGRWVDPQQ